MNPYDTNTRPGAHLVAEKLGISEISTLNITYRPGEPLYSAATRVIGTAYELDALHSRVTRAAQTASDMLAPVGNGEFHGSSSSHVPLQSALRRIEHLLSQQNATYERLSQSIFEYRRLLHAPDARPHSQAAAHELRLGRGSGQEDDWAVAAERRLAALEAVEPGGLRIRLTAIGNDPYLSDTTDRRPQPLIETVQHLIADGLLSQDTNENVYRPGQLLALTPRGEAALRDARATTTRVTAALGRSTTPVGSCALTDSAAVPTVRLPMSSRSR